MTSTNTAVEQPKIKLYWLERSRSQRILWLLEELKLEYELIVYHRTIEGKFADPELKKIHALGKAPVISIETAGSKEPMIIAESGFIIEYLLDHFAGSTTLRPRRYKDGQEGKVGGETEEWMRFRYLMSYGEGSLMPVLTNLLVSEGIRTASVPFFIKPITGKIASNLRSGFVEPNLQAHFSFLENQISTSPESGQYLCGPRLTGADIFMSFSLMASTDKKVLVESDYPKLYAYAKRLEEESGYKKAVEKIISIEGECKVV